MSDPWITPSDTLVTELWPDASTLAEETVTDLIASAQQQCEDYLPHTRNMDGDLVPVIPEPVPANYRTALVMQARALYRSTVAGSGDQLGGDGLSVSVFPMDWTVKNLLRPRKVGRVQ